MESVCSRFRKQVHNIQRGCDQQETRRRDSPVEPALLAAFPVKVFPAYIRLGRGTDASHAYTKMQEMHGQPNEPPAGLRGGQGYVVWKERDFKHDSGGNILHTLDKPFLADDPLWSGCCRTDIAHPSFSFPIERSAIGWRPS